jgi:hypothetical protein
MRRRLDNGIVLENIGIYIFLLDKFICAEGFLTCVMIAQRAKYAFSSSGITKNHLSYFFFFYFYFLEFVLHLWLCPSPTFSKTHLAKHTQDI